METKYKNVHDAIAVLFSSELSDDVLSLIFKMPNDMYKIISSSNSYFYPAPNFPGIEVVRRDAFFVRNALDASEKGTTKEQILEFARDTTNSKVDTRTYEKIKKELDAYSD